jgi:hypothetical protein
MALQNAGRPATARPVNEPPLSCAEADNVKIALNRLQPQAQREIAARLRRQLLVLHQHHLGPSPLEHFIREVEAGADVTARLECYAKIDPEFVRALGGDQFAPLVHVIDEGGHG